MADIASLTIRIESLEAELADKRLKRLANTGYKTEKATDGLASSFKRLAGPLIATASATAGLSKLVSVSREFGKLNAQLATATGSAENADIAFEALQGFAAETPYDLQQVTEGFTKLVNLGLDPSEEALTSYGNTASAMGKSLNQLIEAVADAATGEFERLKEFGIKSKSEGDKVSFTFRGVTKTIGKNAEEIEGYLKDLGDNEFSGAMERQMDTLDGAISNLSDEWNKLFYNVSELGTGELIESGFRVAIDAVEELNAIMASGEFTAILDAQAERFGVFADDAKEAIELIKKYWSEMTVNIDGQTSEVIDSVSNAFGNLPENVRSFIQLMTVELAAFIDKTAAYGTEILENLTFWKDETFDLDDRLRQINEVREDSIVGIFAERSAIIDNKEEKLKASEEVRKAYDKEVEAKKATAVLGQFKVGGTTTKQESPEAKKAREKEQQARAEALEDLRKSLRTEEEVIEESYANRLSIILENTAAGSAQQKELKARLDADVASTKNAALDDLTESLRTEEEVISDSYNRRLAVILQKTEEGSEQQKELKARLDESFATEAIGSLAAPDTWDEQLASLQSFYDDRRELILSNSALTEEARTELEEELTIQRNERLAALEQQRMSSIFSAGEQLFGGLSGLAKAYGGEQNALYKSLFAASKAFAVADSVIKIQQGIAGAAALPFPSNIAAMATVVAETSSIVSTIAGTQFSGAYDKGGMIPAGKIGLVGEFGPELIEGPTNVRSRKETAEIFNGAGGSGAAPSVENNLRIVNVIDPSVVNDFMSSGEGERVILNVVRNNPEMIRALASG